MRLERRVFVLRGVGATLLVGAPAEFGGRPPRRRQAANALGWLRRAQDDAFVMGELRRWFTRWQLDPPQLTPAGDAELVRRTVAAIDRGRLVARLVPVARTPATGEGGDDRSFRLAQAGGAAPGGRTGADLVAMSPAERIAEMLERTIPRLPGHLRDEFVALLVGAGVTRLASAAGVWLGLHAFGVGLVSDLLLAALLLFGVAMSGQDVIEAARDFVSALTTAASAVDETDLDAAAESMARVVAKVGVGIAAVLLTRSKGMGGASGERRAHRGRAQPPSAKEMARQPVGERPPESPRKTPGAGRGPTFEDSEHSPLPPKGGDAPADAKAKASAVASSPPGSAPAFLKRQYEGVEPGAEPMTPELLREIAEGKLIAQWGKIPQKKGFPKLDRQDLASFAAEPAPERLHGPRKLYRIIGAENAPDGAYWSPDPPPANEAIWRARNAVTGKMSGNGGYVVHEIGEGEFLDVWAGPIRAQQSSDGASALRGGGTQFFVGRGKTKAGTIQPTGWKQG